MKFETAHDQQSPLASPSWGQATDQEIIRSLPPEEQDIFRPISDLETDPDLLTIFQCATDGVWVCHFPNNTESAHTLCVGLPAVSSHQEHEVEVDASGNVLQLSDYLGPCKH